VSGLDNDGESSSIVKLVNAYCWHGKEKWETDDRAATLAAGFISSD
jgi:hypothetical protein